MAVAAADPLSNDAAGACGWDWDLDPWSPVSGRPPPAPEPAAAIWTAPPWSVVEVGAASVGPGGGDARGAAVAAWVWLALAVAADSGAGVAREGPVGWLADAGADAASCKEAATARSGVCGADGAGVFTAGTAEGRAWGAAAVAPGVWDGSGRAAGAGPGWADAGSETSRMGTGEAVAAA
jgi:hypothetical protein